MALPPEELLAGTRRALLHRLAVGQAEGRTPSLVGAVVRGGHPVWTDGRSMIDGHAPDDDVQYRIGSITKSFVAVLVMRLRDEGLLSLTDPLEQHLPGTAAGRLTIAQLLAHTSGLASETPGPWWERTTGTLRPELADVLGEQPVRHPAGSRFHYSNPGFALLGALVERLRGEPWGEVLRREVLEPLGLTRTTLAPQAPHAGGFAVHPWADVMLPEPLEDTEVMAPAGQLWSTAADLCRWAAFLAAGDELVLSPGSIAEMRRPASEPDGAEWTSAYGFGLQLLRRDGRVLYGHTGSMPGFLATLWVSAQDDVSAVVLANATSGTPVGEIAADLIRIVVEHEPRFPAPWRPLPEADPELLALTGPWYWGASPHILRLRADRALELAPLNGPGRGAGFRAEADGTWTGLDGYYAGETLRVVRAADGTASHLDIGSFVLTRAPYDPGTPIPGGVDPGGWRAY
ncbi:serine hydrolase domain-containing protein [Kitasatospora sp. MAP5-34]|uniref:serine hydrolase domain-containing protein n=1 Tax=Kitasatospora sp. MAP5-34 TaxID=3035102 RepID=UPI0024767F44|nr:serine hydrolase domain-containing protein [Kitasatospora sp. MAP5-34]MDH6579194.1 CubicO group peptidase (beta-lactamase class C family) [Kitasatospora sp. MAP5-34]